MNMLVPKLKSTLGCLALVQTVHTLSLEPLPPLPIGVEGVWSGPPTSTILGPWNDNAVFAIQKLHDASGYLISDTMSHTKLIPLGFQRFWFQSPVKSGAPATMTYCGVIGSGYFADKYSEKVGAIRFLARMNSSLSNTKSVVYSWTQQLLPHSGEITVTYTVTLLSQTSLRLHLQFDNANHLDVTLKRIADAPPLTNPPDSRMGDGGHTCNVSKALPTQTVHPWAGSSCPVLKKRLNAKSTSLQATSASNAGTKMCYIIQPFADFNLSWVVPHPNDEKITISVNASVPNGDHGMWFGIGFPSTFPSMANMPSAVMIYTNVGRPVVKSMFTEGPWDAPSSVDKMPLENTAANVAVDGQLSFTFTRELSNKYGPISRYPVSVTPALRSRLYFASGQLDSSGSPTYHGRNRGVFIVDWFHPELVLTRPC